MATDIRETKLETAPDTESLECLLECLIARVGRDSREQAEQYLEESVVPHGGE